MINIKIKSEPVPQARPRFSNGKVYDTKRCKEYKAKVSWGARLAMGEVEPLEGAVECVIKIYRKYKATSRRFGDFDNLAKSITDALTGICYKDDSQIVSCLIKKIQSNDSGVEILLKDVGNLGTSEPTSKKAGRLSRSLAR